MKTPEEMAKIVFGFDYIDNVNPKSRTIYGDSALLTNIIAIQQDANEKNYPETHKQGHVSIENKEIIESMDLQDLDFGVQISTDGRVWICLNGIAFLRFKPHRHQPK